jgi:hypothetical protein
MTVLTLLHSDVCSLDITAQNPGNYKNCHFELM